MISRRCRCLSASMTFKTVLCSFSAKKTMPSGLLTKWRRHLSSNKQSLVRYAKKLMMTFSKRRARRPQAPLSSTVILVVIAAIAETSQLDARRPGSASGNFDAPQMYLAAVTSSSPSSMRTSMHWSQ